MLRDLIRRFEPNVTGRSFEPVEKIRSGCAACRARRRVGVAQRLAEVADIALELGARVGPEAPHDRRGTGRPVEPIHHRFEHAADAEPRVMVEPGVGVPEVQDPLVRQPLGQRFPGPVKAGSLKPCMPSCVRCTPLTSA